jgi:hypothetical protein
VRIRLRDKEPLLKEHGPLATGTVGGLKEPAQQEENSDGTGGAQASLVSLAYIVPT